MQPEIDPDRMVLVVIRGVPEDARLSAGVRDDDGSWLLSPLDLSTVTIALGTERPDADGDLGITGIALTEAGDLTAICETVPLADYLADPGPDSDRTAARLPGADAARDGGSSEPAARRDRARGRPAGMVRRWFRRPGDPRSAGRGTTVGRVARRGDRRLGAAAAGSRRACDRAAARAERRLHGHASRDRAACRRPRRRAYPGPDPGQGCLSLGAPPGAGRSFPLSVSLTRRRGPARSARRWARRVRGSPSPGTLLAVRRPAAAFAVRGRHADGQSLRNLQSCGAGKNPDAGAANAPRRDDDKGGFK